MRTARVHNHFAPLRSGLYCALGFGKRSSCKWAVGIPRPWSQCTTREKFAVLVGESVTSMSMTERG